MSTIFVSHSEKDLGIVNEIIRGLEQAGYGTWYFERDILPGSSYLVQITTAVAECDAIILVISSNSIGSDQVSKEVVGAFERQKPFFPILLDMTPPQLKETQPEWRHALGGTAMICVATDGLAACIPRIIEGLKAMGIQPEAGVSGAFAPKPNSPAVASYTPKHLAEKILAARKTIEGERKQVTVLFADVSGFTSMSERMDPEEVHHLISEALVPISEEVHRYEGTIVQFLGDGIMALFGAPIAHEDAPQRALHAALGIRERVREYARKLKKQGIEFDMHIGLNSGLVMVGKIGDDLTMEYTAMGDTVNLASRMGSMARPGAILVSEDTYRLTEGYFDFKPLGELQVKGKKEPVKAYELLRAGRARTRFGASVARGLTPFVGRQRELDQLMVCYERVRKGQGQVVGIVGEPGVGKSRLVLQMRETLPQEEYTYLEGECLHHGDAIAYLPLLHILRSYFDIEEGEPESGAGRKMKEGIKRLDERLAAILPPLQDILSLKVEDEPYLKLEPQKKRERIFEAIRNLLIRESQRRPLVLGIENLQWGDPTSQEFLGHLITSLAHNHIFLVLLYRPEYTPTWVSKSYYSQVSLDELSPEASAEMVQAMLREGKAAPELNDLILGRAAGNPLFMEEFTRALLERGYIQRSNGHYVLAAQPSEIQVPETVQGIIGARIDRLEDRLKQTLQVASVIGRGFSFPILQTIIGAREDLKSHLADLQSREFIYEESPFPELEYSFKHGLTQEVAYSTLLLKRRKEIHQRAGQAIEQLYRSRLEEFCEALAHHYSMADDPEKAFQYLKLSAEKAHRSYSTREAFRYYSEALKALGRLPDSEQNKRARIDMTVSMVSVMVALNLMEGSLGILEEAQKAAEELGDRSASLRLNGLIGAAHSRAGNTSEGLKFTQKAFEEAEKLGDEYTVLTTAMILCTGYFLRGKVAGTADVAGRAIALLEKRQATSTGPVPQFDQYVSFLSFFGWARAMLGDFDEGERLCQKAIRRASEVKSQYSLAAAHMFLSVVSVNRGKAETTLHHAREAMRLGEEAQMPFLLGPCWGIEGWGHYFQDDLPAARECAGKGLSLALEHRFPEALSGAHLLSGLVSQALGDLPEARSSFEQGLKVAQDSYQKVYEAQAKTYLGRLLVEEDPSQAAAAEQMILEGMTIMDEINSRPSQAFGHLYLGETYALAGQREKALASLKRAREMCQEMGMDYYLARTEKALQKLRG